VQLTYHGQSAFEIDHGGTKILIDPWIDGNPHTEKSAEEFTDVSTVLVTHGAFDHLGDAPEIARRNGATLVCDFATHTVLADRGFPEDLLQGYVFGAEHDADGWSAKVVEAHHQSMYAEEGVIGPAIAYVVRIGDHRIYHMGDTSISRDIELFGELYDPTITLVPVGRTEGYFTELHPDEAALVAEWLPSDLFVPMHYVPGSDNPREFREHAADRGVTERSEVRLLDPGGSIDR
jgi:L-ascorbate metabolism protein UlaG (beta-lactamase superfamily)